VASGAGPSTWFGFAHHRLLRAGEECDGVVAEDALACEQMGGDIDIVSARVWAEGKRG